MKFLFVIALCLNFTSCFAKDLKLTCNGDGPYFQIDLDEQNFIFKLPSDDIEATFEVTDKTVSSSKTKLELSRVSGDQSISEVVIQKAAKYECQEIESGSKRTITFRLNQTELSGCCSEE